MQTFATEAVDWPDTATRLRDQVRDLVAQHGERDPVRRANSWTKPNPAFSRKLGDAGLLGMTWPKEYGGHERSQLERYVVIEELLAAGAPVGAHWIADRQSGPLLLRLGNDRLKRRWVPAIARGEAFACIGLSEPGSGSDLASVRTSARRDGDEWIINGQKVWTTHGQDADYIWLAARTDPDAPKHKGISILLVPTSDPGFSVTPIYTLGRERTNVTYYKDVRVPVTNRVGPENAGWSLITSQLNHERIVLAIPGVAESAFHHGNHASHMMGDDDEIRAAVEDSRKDQSPHR